MNGNLLPVALIAALIILPRLATLRDFVAGLWPKANIPEDPKPQVAFDQDACLLAAFKTLRPRLGSDLAKQVWATIQPTDPEEPKL